MAVTIVRNSLSGKSVSNILGKRMFIHAESTGTLALAVPYAPEEIDYDGIGLEWAQAERPGDKPLLLRKGDQLGTVKLTVRLASPDRYASQTAAIAAIRGLAKTRERVLVRYGSTEAGLWRLTEVSIASLRRHPDTSEITDATVSMTLTEASDAAPAVGPVSPPPPPPPPPKPPPPRVHVVVKGECLWRIAQRYYGHGPLWPRVYDANRGQIKNPHWIYPGQRFVIP